MSLSPVKKEILETLSRSGKAMRATDVAKEAGKQFPPVMMHLLGLVKMGYVTSPEKGLYVINDKGKEAIAQPEITKEKAENGTLRFLLLASARLAFRWVSAGYVNTCPLYV